MDENECNDCNDYMAIVYKHPALVVCTENNYKSVKIVEDVEFGELLLVEHSYAGSVMLCQAILENNEYLFDMYHPRTDKYVESTDKHKQTKDKISHNCFGLKNGDKLITFIVTKLNHSCDPNCSIFIQENYNMENTYIIFVELYAIRSIKGGTELTINYGPITAHERDFECKCGKELEERQKIFEIVANIGKSLSNKNNLQIKKMVYQYLEKKISKKILLNHYLATKGIFINNNMISAYTKDGEKMINDVIHKYLALNKDINVEGKIVEDNMNIHKINLFLLLIKNNLL